MHILIAITVVSLLHSVELAVLAESDFSEFNKQCGVDERCVDISFCPELTQSDDFGDDNESQETLFSKFEDYREKLYDAFCGMDPKTSYRKYCCRLPPENKINTPNCGLPVENRVLIPTYDLFENPWMVLIRNRENGAYCSGTIIAGSFILTAASCSHASTGGDSVRVGEYDIVSPVDCTNDNEECTEPPTDVATLTFLLHPEYNRLTRKNDIALLKIETVQFSKSVAPICLFSEAQPRGSIVGWNSPESKPSKIQASVVEAEKCKQTIEGYSNGTKTMDNKLCVRLELSGNCEDSRQYILPGSSFQTGIGQGGAWVQQGILLETSRCDQSDRTIYAVLTNVTSYMDWIRDNDHYIHPTHLENIADYGNIFNR